MARFRTILVPTDFSEGAGAALDWALALAKESGGTVHLLHAYEIPLGTIPPYGIEVPPSMLTDVRDAAARRLEQVAQKVRARDVACESQLVHGLAATSIVEAARAIHADAIVMGTRGLTGVKHVLLGSVAERVVRTAPCAVLTVRPGAGSVTQFDHVLVPVDFSTHSETALGVAIELAKEHGSELHLLHAYELPASVTMTYGLALPESVWKGVQEAGAARLAELAAQARAAEVRVKLHLVTGPASDAIVDNATALHADLVVMGTRGLTGLKHVVLGSVAERAIRLAPCPVLTVKADDAT